MVKQISVRNQKLFFMYILFIIIELEKKKIMKEFQNDFTNKSG